MFSASLRNAAGLKAVLDLVDKDYSSDCGEQIGAVASVQSMWSLLFLEAVLVSVYCTNHCVSQSPCKSTEMDCKSIS